MVNLTMNDCLISETGTALLKTAEVCQIWDWDMLCTC